VYNSRSQNAILQATKISLVLVTPIPQEDFLMLKQVVRFAAILLCSGMLAGAQTIPAGTKITIRTESQINSGSARTGQIVSGTLARDVVANGKTVIKAPAPVKIKISAAKSSGRLHAPGELTLRLVSVDGTSVSTSAFRAKGKSHTKSNVTKIGGGAAAGALLGGLMGGGKGALIGTAAGAGAGTGLAAATGKEEAVVHAETAITFTTTATAKKK
jgi:hypothetical protein